jgi:hypothetical protein
MTDLPIVALAIVLSLGIGYWLARRQAAQSIIDLQSQVVRLQREKIEIKETSSKNTLEEYKNSEEYRALLALQFEAGKAQGSTESLADFKASEEFNLLLNSEHAKGKLAGAAEELEKFHITYTPVLVDHETFFTHKVDAGYDMQIHYAGFPIGEPTRRITNHQEKSKDENITRVLEMVGKALEIAAAAATKQKIPVTVAKAPRRVNKK